MVGGQPPEASLPRLAFPMMDKSMTGWLPGDRYIRKKPKEAKGASFGF